MIWEMPEINSLQTLWLKIFRCQIKISNGIHDFPKFFREYSSGRKTLEIFIPKHQNPVTPSSEKFQIQTRLTHQECYEDFIWGKSLNQVVALSFRKAESLHTFIYLSRYF